MSNLGVIGVLGVAWQRLEGMQFPRQIAVQRWGEKASYWGKAAPLGSFGSGRDLAPCQLPAAPILDLTSCPALGRCRALVPAVKCETVGFPGTGQAAAISPWPQ